MLKGASLWRVLLFAYCALLLCPIRYWPLASDTDNTWVFALNYAAAHGLAVGRDVVFTTGPLGWLVFPQDIGNNLARALVFQAAVWILLIGIAADLFYRTAIELRNLALFAGLLGLAAPLFWFNRIGIENQMLAAALVLLWLYRARGGTWRYVTALAFIGIVPLIKVSAALVAGGALAGFLVESAIRLRWKAWREIVLAAVVPAVTAGVACYLTLPSVAALGNFLRASAEIAGGYSAALSLEGPNKLVFAAAAEALALVAALLVIHYTADRRLAWFFALLFALPLFAGFKHGFVRQDQHVANFFCFAALAMAVMALAAPARGWRLTCLLCVLPPFFVIWQDWVGVWDFRGAVAEATGARALAMIVPLLRGGLHARLERQSAAKFEPEERLEPEIRAMIGDRPVASLSETYSDAYLDHLDLRLYPVIQRYQAYTPYLDGLNAEWIRDKGPRFLTFDGLAINSRERWAETPAMWAEVYRWYNTRALGSRHLLLERRAGPRFGRFESLRRWRGPAASLEIPEGPGPVFWTMRCGMNRRGKLLSLLFRVPAAEIEVRKAGGTAKSYRVIPEVLSSPVMGTWLPGTLAETAAVFAESGSPGFAVRRLLFGGEGMACYSGECEFELLRTAP